MSSLSFGLVALLLGAQPAPAAPAPAPAPAQAPAPAAEPAPAFDFKAEFDKRFQRYIEVHGSSEPALVAEEKSLADEQAELLARWKAARPADLERLVACANFAFNRARTVEASPHDAALLDPVRREIRLPTPRVRHDPKGTQEALGCLREGLEREPRRLDIHFGLIAMCQDMGDFECVENGLREAVAVTKRHPKELLWLESKPFEGDPERFMPENIQARIGAFWEPGGDNQRVLKLAKLATDSYPSCAFCWSSLAGYYLHKGDLAPALGHLEKAHALDADDPIIEMNLGRTLHRMGQPARARPHFEKVIELGSRSALDELLAAASELKRGPNLAGLTAPGGAAIELAKDDDAALGEDLEEIRKLQGEAGVPPQMKAEAWCDFAQDAEKASFAKQAQAECDRWSAYAKAVQKRTEESQAKDLEAVRRYLKRQGLTRDQKLAAVSAFLWTYRQASEMPLEEARKLRDDLRRGP